MAVYTNDLRLKEIATGDESGTWGTSTNTNLSLIADAFGFGTEAITTNADTHTTTIADGSADPGRSIFLKYTGTLDSACTITIGPNTVSKLWFIENATSGSQNIIIKQGSGATITVPNGQTKAIYSDGAGSGAAMVDAFASLNVVDLSVEDDLSVTDDVSIGGTLGVTGVLTATSLDISGDIDVDGTTNLDVVDIDGAVDMASTLQVDGAITSSAGATITTADNSTQLTLKSTDADANLGPVLDLLRDGGSPADSDFIGQVRFQAKDDGGNVHEYAKILGQIADVTGGTEDGILMIRTILAGTDTRRIDLGTSELVINEDSANLDTRIESDGNTHMLFIDAGNDRVGIGTNSPGYPLDVQSGGVGTVFRAGTSFFSVDATGSASSPSLIFNGDGDTGFYRSASDTIKLSTGGSDRVTFDSSGNFFISTTEANPHTLSSGGGTKFFNSSGSLLAIARDSATVIAANRSGSSAGTVMDFRLDGTIKGDIGVESTGMTINEAGSDLDFRVESNSNTHMLFVDAGNNAVGIGTSSLTEKLEVSGSINTTNQSTNFTAGSQRGFMDIVDSSKHVRIGSLQGAATPSGTEGTVELLVNGATKATIDSSGDLIVGGTSSGANDAVSLSNTGYVQAIVNGDTVGYFNRRTSDGEIIRLQKDGSTVGSIDVDSGALEITGASAINLNDGSNEIGFGTAAIAGNGSSNDAVIDLGRTNRRFKDLHLSGTANTGLLEVASANTTLANFQANVGGAGGVGVVNIKTNTSSSNGLQLVGNGSGASIAGGSLAATVMNTENGPLRFGTNATETARITEAGDLCINNANSSGSSGATSKIFVKVPLSVTSNAFMCQPDTNGTTNAAIFQNSSGANAGFIQYTSTTTTYATSSDYRMKENVVALSGATDRLKQLKPSRFNFIEDADTTVDGFLAHEVQEVVPEAVTGTKDAVDADGNPDYQGIDQSKLVPLLVATIQELEARIAALESE